MNQRKLTRVRSWLFTPADRFDKAATLGADVLTSKHAIMSLEGGET